MPGYANKQEATALNGVNIFVNCPMISELLLVSQAFSKGRCGLLKQLWLKIFNQLLIYKFGNKLIETYTQLGRVRNRDKEFQKAFGKHVKKLREERDWPQEQLSALANIEVNQISRIENGRHAANLHTIRTIAVALGKYPYELLKFEFDIVLNTDFNARHRKGKRPETTNVLNKLTETDFFNSPRSVESIISHCKKIYRVNLKSSATSGALKKLIVAKVLRRVPSPVKSRYLYQKRLK